VRRQQQQRRRRQHCCLRVGSGSGSYSLTRTPVDGVNSLGILFDTILSFFD
jgi:hypothetical protein